MAVEGGGVGRRCSRLASPSCSNACCGLSAAKRPWARGCGFLTSPRGRLHESPRARPSRSGRRGPLGRSAGCPSERRTRLLSTAHLTWWSRSRRGRAPPATVLLPTPVSPGAGSPAHRGAPSPSLCNAIPPALSARTAPSRCGPPGPSVSGQRPICPRCVSSNAVSYFSPYPSARSRPMCASQMSATPCHRLASATREAAPRMAGAG